MSAAPDRAAKARREDAVVRIACKFDSQPDQAEQEAAALLLLDGIAVYPAMRRGPRFAAENLYRRADAWAVVPEKGRAG